MTEGRDPRVDPQAGDCMKKARTSRWLEVMERSPHSVMVKMHGLRLNGCWRWMTLRRWRQWAVTAITVDATRTPTPR